MKDRFQALDSWRGICALMVATGHLPAASHISGLGVVHYSGRFVDFFFVLSGFVIAFAYGDELANAPGAIRNFAIRRLGRLMPLHLFLLLGFILFELAILVAGRAGLNTGREAFSDKDQLATLPANILLIQAWGIYRDTSWNVPAWSISTEIFAYACYAVTASVLGRWGLLAMGLLAAIGVALIAMVAPEGMKSTADFGLARCLFGFGVGVLVETAWRRARGIRLPLATAIEIMACVAIFLVVSYARGQWRIAVVPVSAVLVFVFAFERGAVSRLLRKPLFAWIGERSYSIYMVQALVVQSLLAIMLVAGKMGWSLLGQIDGRVTILGTPWMLDGIVLFYIGLILLVAAATYVLVENPGRLIFNRLARSPRPLVPVGAP